MPLLLAAAVTAPPPATRPAAARSADSTFEIRSYGERPEELIALMSGFLARFQFAEKLPRRATRPGTAQALFTGPGQAFVVITGKYNCIVLGYFLPPGRPSVDVAYRDRLLASFRGRLVGFLGSLPSPEPAVREIDWNAARACGPAP